jgi:hypothetical protein
VCIKTHKRKGKQLVDPGDLVSEKSLAKVYKILGKVKSIHIQNTRISRMIFFTFHRSNSLNVNIEK